MGTAPRTLSILGHAAHGQGHDHDFDEPIGLLTDCHRRIEKFLEILQRVAREYSGRPLDAKAADAVRTAKRYFSYAAPKHTADEEKSLFPRMKAAVAAGKTPPCEALARLEDDHQHADAMHARVDTLLGLWLGGSEVEGGGAAVLPPGQAAELSSLLDSLRELYRDHIRVEETEVFPLAGRLLTAPDLAEMGQEMRARRGLAGRAGGAGAAPR